MNEQTQLVLEKALAWAFQHKVSLALASTTGATAQKLVDLRGGRPVRFIVTYHGGWCCPPQWNFEPSIRENLVRQGVCLVEDRSAFYPAIRIGEWIERHLKVSLRWGREAFWHEMLGTGGFVCYKMLKGLAARGIVREGETLVAVGGKISGADTALAVEVIKRKPFKLALLEILGQPVPEGEI